MLGWVAGAGSDMRGSGVIYRWICSVWAMWSEKRLAGVTIACRCDECREKKGPRQGSRRRRQTKRAEPALGTRQGPNALPQGLFWQQQPWLAREAQLARWPALGDPGRAMMLPSFIAHNMCNYVEICRFCRFMHDDLEETIHRPCFQISPSSLGARIH